MRAAIGTRFLPAAIVGVVVFSASQLFMLASARAYTETTLYSFCSQANCADGNSPLDALISDASGNLYGTTSRGGNDFDAGTVFELVRPKGRAKDWTLRTLYTFCSDDGSCADGAHPVGGLIFDVAGNLYGTTSGGFGGTIFELSPKGNRWKLKTLHTFCNCGNSDGRSPLGTLTYAGASNGSLYDGVSPLYGTTMFGGASDTGIVFELTQDGGHWKAKTIHDFPSFGGDGSYVNAQLFIDGAGDIFGTTKYGGSGDGSGTLFEFVPQRSKAWQYRILHSFCSDCAEGYEPGGGGALAMDGAGAVYGATMLGGAGGGSIFKLLPRGRKSNVGTLYSYCTVQDCPDGGAVSGGVVLDNAGNIFALAPYGGAGGGGTLLKLSPSGEMLSQYNFCGEQTCGGGTYPAATVMVDQGGNLFGTTQLGGAHDDGNGHGGTVFELTP